MHEESSQTCVIQLGDHHDKGPMLSVLAVGDADEWQQQGHIFPQGNFSFIAFEDVTEATLAHYKPEIIVSPVLADRFDCIELTLLLRNLGYQGAYRAVALDMPKPELIEREVTQLFPGLDFKIDVQPKG